MKEKKEAPDSSQPVQAVIFDCVLDQIEQKRTIPNSSTKCWQMLLGVVDSVQMNLS